MYYKILLALIFTASCSLQAMNGQQESKRKSAASAAAEFTFMVWSGNSKQSEITVPQAHAMKFTKLAPFIKAGQVNTRYRADAIKNLFAFIADYEKKTHDSTFEGDIVWDFKVDNFVEMNNFIKDYNLEILPEVVRQAFETACEQALQKGSKPNGHVRIILSKKIERPHVTAPVRKSEPKKSSQDKAHARKQKRKQVKAALQQEPVTAPVTPAVPAPRLAKPKSAESKYMNDEGKKILEKMQAFLNASTAQEFATTADAAIAQIEKFETELARDGSREDIEGESVLPKGPIFHKDNDFILESDDYKWGIAQENALKFEKLKNRLNQGYQNFTIDNYSKNSVIGLFKLILFYKSQVQKSAIETIKKQLIGWACNKFTINELVEMYHFICDLNWQGEAEIPSVIIESILRMPGCLYMLLNDLEGDMLEVKEKYKTKWAFAELAVSKKARTLAASLSNSLPINVILLIEFMLIMDRETLKEKQQKIFEALLAKYPETQKIIEDLQKQLVPHSVVTVVSEAAPVAQEKAQSHAPVQPAVAAVPAPQAAPAVIEQAPAPLVPEPLAPEPLIQEPLVSVVQAPTIKPVVEAQSNITESSTKPVLTSSHSWFSKIQNYMKPMFMIGAGVATIYWLYKKFHLKRILQNW